MAFEIKSISIYVAYFTDSYTKILPEEIIIISKLYRLQKKLEMKLYAY